MMIKLQLLVIILCLSSAGFAATDGKKFIGKFSHILRGDYPHIVLLDASANEVSFWCGAMPGEALSCDELEANAKKYEGKRLKISYRIIKSFVPEAQEEINKEETIKIELLR